MHIHAMLNLLASFRIWRTFRLRKWLFLDVFGGSDTRPKLAKLPHAVKPFRDSRSSQKLPVFVFFGMLFNCSLWTQDSVANFKCTKSLFFQDIIN